MGFVTNELGATSWKELDPLYTDLASRSLEGVDQFWGQPGKIHSQPLDAIVEIGIDGFNHGIATSVVDVDGCDAACLDVVKEASVAHPRDGGIPGCHGRAAGAHSVDASVAHDLPADQQDHGDRQEPENKEAPALIHDPEK